MNAIITRVAHLRTVGAIPSSKTSRKSTVRAVPEIAQLAGLQVKQSPMDWVQQCH